MRHIGERQGRVVDALHGPNGAREDGDGVLHAAELLRHQHGRLEVVALHARPHRGAHSVQAQQRLHRRAIHPVRLCGRQDASKLHRRVGRDASQVVPRGDGEGHRPSAAVVARPMVVAAVLRRLGTEHATDLDELPEGRAGVVEAHRSSVEAEDEEEGHRHGQQAVALLHGACAGKPQHSRAHDVGLAEHADEDGLQNDDEPRRQDVPEASSSPSAEGAPDPPRAVAPVRVRLEDGPLGILHLLRVVGCQRGD
mmetsp:Transcript_118605/g.332118  ORF Transcript_118605/g.332118 Transcript_118605/m.332118 type:complete len:253 (+) Transcript_118605:383-1141(+)